MTSRKRWTKTYKNVSFGESLDIPEMYHISETKTGIIQLDGTKFSNMEHGKWLIIIEHIHLLDEPINDSNSDIVVLTCDAVISNETWTEKYDFEKPLATYRTWLIPQTRSEPAIINNPKSKMTLTVRDVQTGKVYGDGEKCIAVNYRFKQKLI